MLAQTPCKRLCNLQGEYVEPWVSRFSNIGIRSTQRAKSMNRALKRVLGADCPLRDLFCALLKMGKKLDETRAFINFQARHKPGIYPETISHLVGVATKYILGIVKTKYSKSKCISIVANTAGQWLFSDTCRLTIGQGCSCAFYSQFHAACAHALVIGEQSLITDMFHPGWLVGNAPATLPAISYGPMPEVQISEEDREHTDALTLAATIHRRLVDLPTQQCIVLSKKVLEMLDRGEENIPPPVQDPPVSRSRGRPHKRERNTFNGKNISFISSLYVVETLLKPHFFAINIEVHNATSLPGASLQLHLTSSTQSNVYLILLSNL